ncbi:hypothetical protein [Halalkalibacter akibai]|uniref:Uncharacterized protein n=1 Tax=Halalkalibacter akibai (strain ATCC 43226 / DSM 21942 / CIP 109018 / JCM 9157 / 1139) TaxID=1236973 RepID=W4QZU5_HALA3|nr:hypothetical protein [Halalkalibacter akibai]GAE36839.1 hypothetical protein JCM9157_4060 [Halalkalibacter akibai JCM 9157]
MNSILIWLIWFIISTTYAYFYLNWRITLSVSITGLLTVSLELFQHWNENQDEKEKQEDRY